MAAVFDGLAVAIGLNVNHNIRGWAAMNFSY